RSYSPPLSASVMGTNGTLSAAPCTPIPQVELGSRPDLHLLSDRPFSPQFNACNQVVLLFSCFAVAQQISRLRLHAVERRTSPLEAMLPLTFSGCPMRWNSRSMLRVRS